MKAVEVVDILWRGDDVVQVQVDQGWATKLSPEEFLDAVVCKVNGDRGATEAVDWRLQLSLANVGLSDLAEFSAQLAEARAEEQRFPTKPDVRSTDHFRAVWLSGVLIELTGDDGWSKLPVIPLGEALARAIEAPAAPGGTTVARDRLLRFMAGRV